MEGADAAAEGPLVSDLLFRDHQCCSGPHRYILPLQRFKLTTNNTDFQVLRVP